jgi:hypothetical protein
MAAISGERSKALAKATMIAAVVARMDRTTTRCPSKPGRLVGACGPAPTSALERVARPVVLGAASDGAGVWVGGIAVASMVMAVHPVLAIRS